MDTQAQPASVEKVALVTNGQKMPPEQFILRGIEKFRTKPGRPVKVKKFREAFRKYYDQEIDQYLLLMKKAGKIVLTWGNSNIYTADDYHAKKCDDVIRKILSD